MGHILGRAGVLFSVLMLGFILGIIYSDQDVDLAGVRFDVTEDLPGPQDEKGFVVKESYSNKIQMEDSEGVVVYEEGDNGIKSDLYDDMPHYTEKNGRSEGGTPLSEAGVRTAEIFEDVFGRIFSLIGGA